ncbi:MAG: hypothetical protein KGY80_00025 [Candidatus Thorarchaeota archaeon]|nr:hypothetical protein [Candidatus Thorarchaeota archaeon]
MEDDIEDVSSPSAYDTLRHMLAELKTGNIPKLPQIRTRLELINQSFTERLNSIGMQPSPPVHAPPPEVPLVEYLQRMGSRRV